MPSLKLQVAPFVCETRSHQVNERSLHCGFQADAAVEPLSKPSVRKTMMTTGVQTRWCFRCAFYLWGIVENPGLHRRRDVSEIFGVDGSENHEADRTEY